MCRDLETRRTQRASTLVCWKRLLIFILVLTNSLEGVTFLFAAKSITRYKRISEEQNFAEYYLIGTLLSIIWALTVGLGLRAILANGL
mgnify:CR=1 FL=1